MADVLLRPGTPADVPGLRALGEAVVPATYDAIDAVYGQRMLDEWWTRERFTASLSQIPHVVAECDGRVVGVANLGPAEIRGSQRDVVWKLYVHPDHQGAGVGGRLLAAVEELAQGTELWLEVVDGNHRAAAFYRAHGFQEIERVAATPYPDDIWMRKQLRQGPR
jgi:ribosomal protein S18 acetylase RimI-like enzyme